MSPFLGLPFARWHAPVGLANAGVRIEDGARGAASREWKPVRPGCVVLETRAELRRPPSWKAACPMCFPIAEAQPQETTSLCRAAEGERRSTAWADARIPVARAACVLAERRPARTPCRQRNASTISCDTARCTLSARGDMFTPAGMGWHYRANAQPSDDWNRETIPKQRTLCRQPPPHPLWTHIHGFSHR